MEDKHNNINRRDFIKKIGATGLGSAFVSSRLIAEEEKKAEAEPEAKKEAEEVKLPQVPRRNLGKTGVDIPVLSLGTMYNLVDNQIMLRKSLDWGVNLWDTANNYAGGNSELGIGKYLSEHPEVREKVFIVSKASKARSVEDVENRLQTSLKRLKTNYIDLYYGVHELDKPSQLSDELRRWSESAKKRKLIRYFGFSCHKNMARCLSAASKLEWIDAILASYNFRLMQQSEIQEAVESCHEKDIGLIAMKVTGLRVWYRQKIESEEDKKMIGHFTKKGFTEAQATIKIVLDDKRIGSACIGMQNIGLLTENVAAVLDKTELSDADKEILAEYSRGSCSGYCSGCGDICKSAVPDIPYVSDIMRYLMYYNSYGEREMARELFAEIPSNIRKKLTKTDYRLAEACCPQKMPIKELMKEAVEKLA